MMNINRFSKGISWFAFFIFGLVLAASYLLPSSDLQPKISEALPQAESYQKIGSTPLIFEGTVSQGNGQSTKVGFVVINEAPGYGGPITMVTGIDLNGNIVGTVIANHKDTPTFIQMIINHRYLDQFQGRKISDPLSLQQDIDSVSGATLSSKGITRAISQGSHAVARSQFGIDVTEKREPFKFEIKEAIVFSLLVLMLIGIKFRLKKLRWVTLLGGLVFIGFAFNIPISLANIAGVLMGYFPSIRENLVWYLMLIGIPLITFVLGRNVYCFWLCPFGAVQELTAKIGGGSLKCNHTRFEAGARKIKYGLTYIALLGAFIIKAPGFAGYEPFATLFALQGFGVQWFILPVVLFASLFISRFWCRYFCPVGVANELIWKLNRRFKDWKKGAEPWKKESKVLKT